MSKNRIASRDVYDTGLQGAQTPHQDALRILRLYRYLPRTQEARILGTQLLRSSTSIGANDRAACRGRSWAEFIAKLGIVLEEADEAVFWLELFQEGNIFPAERLNDLVREANELTAVFVSSVRSARGKPLAIRPLTSDLLFCPATEQQRAICAAEAE